MASVLDMTWLDGRFESSGHLLLALHWQNSLVLWDTAKGVKVWKMDVSKPLQTVPATSNIFLGFDHDPFDALRLVLRSRYADLIFQRNQHKMHTYKEFWAATFSWF